MKHLIRAALAVLLVAGIVVATGCGDDSSSSTTAGTAAATAAGNATDRAFIAAMVPHHQSAVAMAKVAQRQGDGAFVTSLADDIVRTQNAEITRMEAIDARLAKAGVTVGDLGMTNHQMGMEMTAGDLAGARPFDRSFMRAMVPHHEGAIAMAKVELARGENAELRSLAKGIIAAQEQEVAAMHKQLGDDAGATMDTMHSGHG